MADYELRIERRTANPTWREDSALHHTSSRWIEQQVTLVTLNEEQWRKIQAAIVAALGEGSKS